MFVISVVIVWTVQKGGGDVLTVTEPRLGSFITVMKREETEAGAVSQTTEVGRRILYEVCWKVSGTQKEVNFYFEDVLNYVYM